MLPTLRIGLAGGGIVADAVGGIRWVNKLVNGWSCHPLPLVFSQNLQE